MAHISTSDLEVAQRCPGLPLDTHRIPELGMSSILRIDEPIFASCPGDKGRAALAFLLFLPAGLDSA
jgi:hypothetical protein